MRTRLLAIDLDGTLLKQDRVPHIENVAAVRRALDSGIRVVLSSGRIAASVSSFSKLLGLDGAMICSNGGHVVGLGGTELLYIGLSPELVRMTLEYTEQVKVHINVYTRHDIFVLRDSEWLRKYRLRVTSVMPEISSLEEVYQMEVLKIILIDEPDAIRDHYKELDTRMGGLAALTESEPEYLEVLAREANKGHGLKVLSESLGVRQEETAAIGDYLNDVEMVQWAGIGAAVANAIDEVKAVADIEMPSNEEAGVAKFIDYLIERNAQYL